MCIECLIEFAEHSKTHKTFIISFKEFINNFLD